jgi:hypothetical protein
MTILLGERAKKYETKGRRRERRTGKEGGGVFEQEDRGVITNIY